MDNLSALSVTEHGENPRRSRRCDPEIQIRYHRVMPLWRFIDMGRSDGQGEVRRRRIWGKSDIQWQRVPLTADAVAGALYCLGWMDIVGPIICNRISSQQIFAIRSALTQEV